MPLDIEKFDVFDPDNQKLLRVAKGDKEEAQLLRKGLDRSAGRLAKAPLPFDSFALTNFRRSFFGDTSLRGAAFREAHWLNTEELQLKARRLAFSGPPDSIREEHSAFCLLMYQGYQTRFLDRHPGEEPEEFIDRPRKTTLNVTRLAIDILSQLYAQRPTRDLDEEKTDPLVQAALKEIWSDDYDLKLLDTDRYTRLEGTVAVRPFYDTESPGNIRLWTFHSHQLRVIPDPAKPWKPKVAIERHEPFRDKSLTIVWTDKTFLEVDQNGNIGEKSGPHGMGRIPLTWFRDRQAMTGSFFVEGRGRSLCPANATLNGKLTDLNEVYQYQGFAVPEIINALEDDITLGPRRPIRFEPQEGQPFGVNFKQPKAPLRDLRAEVEADVANIFREQRIPPAALGAAIQARSLSGVSIREAMRPLLDDLKERARLFTPFDMDLTDNALRVRAEHDPNFDYDPSTQKPVYTITFDPPDFPLQIRDQIAKDQFDVALSIRTPPEIMRRDNPEKYPTDEDAVAQWQENQALLAQNPPPLTGLEEEVEGEDAGFGDAEDLVGGETPQWLQDELAAGGNGDSPSPILDTLLS